MPTLEMLGVETDTIQKEDETAPDSLSYVFREGALMAQTWSVQDRMSHERSVREMLDRIGGLRQGLEQLRAQTDTLWERFNTLALERTLAGELREFLDSIDVELQDLDLRLVGTDCEIDRLRARMHEQQRVLEDKMAVLEPLAHRTSTQSHIGMMLSRVEGLEASLLDKQGVTSTQDEGQHHTTLPGDLLYLRVRLLTTRIALIASNRSKYLSELSAGLFTLLSDIERLKTDMATLLTRADCIKDLSRYWLAYLDIAQGAQGEE